MESVAGNGVELPRWKCHKEVHAFKITAIQKVPGSEIPNSSEYRAEIVGDQVAIQVTSEYMRKHRPQVGGYYVLYEDGYHSFSPAPAFESGYARIQR